MNHIKWIFGEWTFFIILFPNILSHSQPRPQGLWVGRSKMVATPTRRHLGSPSPETLGMRLITSHNFTNSSFCDVTLYHSMPSYLENISVNAFKFYCEGMPQIHPCHMWLHWSKIVLLTKRLQKKVKHQTFLHGDRMSPYKPILLINVSFIH